MDSILKKAKLSSAGGRPPVAIEITPEGVVAAALPASGSTPVFAFAALPSGAVTPSTEAANLHSAEVVSNAIRSALDEVSPRTRSVSVVLPDILVRVFVIDFDTLPAKPAEAIPVVRFRLRKMVPFDVEHAGLSYQLVSQKQDEYKVLAAIVPGPVLAEYEGAVRAASYEPGAVLSSSLAALDAVESMEAVLTANLSGQVLTTTIANGQDLLLYRTLDLPEDPEQRVAEIQRGIAVAIAYFEDKLQARPRRLHYTGNRRVEEFASWIDDPELAVVELVRRPESGALTSLGTANLAGVAGALSIHGEQAVVSR